MARPLLIGVGMEMAGDDAAGRLVARGLAGREGFDVAECQGMAADLVNLMEGRDRVLIVDACRSCAAPGTIHRIDATVGALPSALSSASSHGIGVAEAIRLARALSLLPRRCEIWAVEGRSFRLGAPLTPAVSEAVERCLGEIPGFLCPDLPPPSRQ